MTTIPPNNSSTPAPSPSATGTLTDEWVRALITGLAALREARRWSQQALADQSGLHRVTISRLEHLAPTAKRPSAATLTALGHAFGYVHMGGFWQALAGVATQPPLDHALLQSDVHAFVRAYLDCSPKQQQFLRGLAFLYAARHQAQAAGEAALLDLASIPGLPASGPPTSRQGLNKR